MTTYTSQQDDSGVLDSWMNQANTTQTNATSTTLIVGQNTSYAERAILKFDLSLGTNVPPVNAIVSAASITLNCSTYRATRVLRAFPILRNQVLGQACWDNWKTGSAWTSKGCGGSDTDYNATESGNISVAGTGSKVITLDANGIATVQGWIDGSIANYGWMLRQDSEGSGSNNTYDAAENATAGNRPLLTVEYTIPGGYPKIFTLS